MNLFLLTCVLAAPADAPAAVAAPAQLPTVTAFSAGPVVGGCGVGCGGGQCAAGICPGTSDPCPFEKKGIFARLRNAFRPKNKCVECIPAPSTKSCSLFGWLKKPVNYCGANCGGGCGVGLSGCSSCGLPAIPGTPVVAPTAPAPAPAAPAPMPAQPAPAPAGEKAAPGKVNISIPAVPAVMPGKPAF